MGFYIELNSQKDHAKILIENAGATLVNDPKWPAPEGKVYVCTVSNPHFDASAIAFDEMEFNRFSRVGDFRPKKWLLIDRATAITLNRAVEPYLK